MNASNSGGTARRNVCNPKESTLKEIRVSDLQVRYCIFPGQKQDTYWTDLVVTFDQLDLLSSNMNNIQQMKYEIKVIFISESTV